MFGQLLSHRLYDKAAGLARCRVLHIVLHKHNCPLVSGGDIGIWLQGHSSWLRFIKQTSPERLNVTTSIHVYEATMLHNVTS